MAEKKTTRIQFTEDELNDSRVQKAAQRAEKAVGKAERAKARLPTKRRLRWEREGAENTLHTERMSGQSAASSPEKEKKAQRKQIRTEAEMAKKRKGKLTFEKTEAGQPSAITRTLAHTPVSVLSGEAHRAVYRNNADENSGVNAAHFTEESAEGTVRAAEHSSYSRKLKKIRRAEKLEAKADAANVEALYQKALHENPEAASNPFSRFRQRQAIKKEYAAMKAGQSVGSAKDTASAASQVAKKAKEGAGALWEKAAAFAKSHSHILLVVLAAGLLLVLVSGMFSSCSAMLSGSGNVILGTSFTAEEADIKGADEDFTALENALQSQIDNIERTHSGYDEYRYNLAQIGHNPYELAALLTVQYEDYTRAEVQSELRRIFDAQYELTLEEEVEIRTRIETHTSTSTDPETGESSTEEYEVEVEYEYYILNVTLTNSDISAVARSSSLSDDQLERYDVLLETRGNRDDLFGDVTFAVPGEYTDYDIPGEALTDEKFRRMIAEAEKYLGYPYVWGGSSPSTSFDCSGFVSWVINNCGNGWSVGRQTAEGLRNRCAIIPRSEAKPGDLIFFQGTYNTSGASHVGIYVGSGMMIHCGNPISYASVETSYWQQHFMCFGRIG